MSVFPTFFLENLKPLTKFGDETTLCLYEPSKKLYIMKRTDINRKNYYETIASVSNPHLAKPLYIFSEGDTLCVVREYLSGDSLSLRLGEKKTFSEEEAAHIAIQICDGLAPLHQKGIVHRDINPNNILITSDGVVKIIDYGIARSFSSDKSIDTVILGTPGYAAPEQFGFSQSNGQTDIYAIGVLLNVMLTGELPSEKKVSGPLGKIIKKCIEIDAVKRFQTVKDLKNALLHNTGGDTKADRILKQIPGFRCGNLPLSLLALSAYLFALLFSVAFFISTNGGPAQYFFTGVAWLFIMVVPYFCFTNFLDIRNRLPFTKGSAKKTQQIIYTVFGILSIAFGLILICIIPS